MKKPFQLKRKTVVRLVKREFGIENFKLDRIMTDGTIYIFKAQLGRFSVTIENDWYDNNGCINMTISPGNGEGIFLCYDPWTLKENTAAAARLREAVQKELLEH